MHGTGHAGNWLGVFAVCSAAIATVILLAFLFFGRRSARMASQHATSGIQNGVSDGATKVWLLLGLGVFPIATAVSANIKGFEATQSRTFCGSCHVMGPHADDSNDAHSNSLSAIHARNRYFGSDNCYTCHKDYGMYGFVLTKLGGMRHVYYYLTEYRDMPVERSKHEIRIQRPLPNDTCMGCHSTSAPRWLALGDHGSTLASLRDGSVACASAGCHGYAHPITKLGKELGIDGGPGP